MILLRKGLKTHIVISLTIDFCISSVSICNGFGLTPAGMIGSTISRLSTLQSRRCVSSAGSRLRFQTSYSTSTTGGDNCGIQLLQAQRRHSSIPTTLLHATPADDTPPVPPTTKTSTNIDNASTPVHLAEGLCAVQKPLEWTSQDAVAFVRGMLERDARGRGAKLAKRRGKGKNKVKVGHGGTLDPLAEGVLVLGVGRGTKMLQSYLSGSKTYRAGVKLGFETTTLDMAGNITDTVPDSSDAISRVTLEAIEKILPQFTGEIMQIPPVYSAIRKNGKRMYEEARAGKTAEEVGIEARPVEVKRIRLMPVDDGGEGLPCFGLEVECGGGTYIRSLVRDIGRELGTFATMTSLVRTQQGPFHLDMALEKDDWSVENINEALERNNAMLEAEEVDEDDASCS